MTASKEYHSFTASLRKAIINLLSRLNCGLFQKHLSMEAVKSDREGYIHVRFYTKGTTVSKFIFGMEITQQDFNEYISLQKEVE
jgi:hypothetical protein